MVLNYLVFVAYNLEQAEPGGGERVKKTEIDFTVCACLPRYLHFLFIDLSDE